MRALVVPSVWIVLGASASSEAAECVGWVKRSDVSGTFQAALALSGDPTAQGAVLRAGREKLECLKQPADAVFAAEVHRYMGLLALTSSDEAGASGSFAAAKVLDPTGTLPAGLPETHPAVALSAAATPPPAPDPTVEGATNPEDLAAMLAVLDAEAGFRFDGSPSPARPFGLPSLVQIADAGGSVKLTRYVAANEALPSWSPPPVGAAVASAAGAESGDSGGAAGGEAGDAAGVTVADGGAAGETPAPSDLLAGDDARVEIDPSQLGPRPVVEVQKRVPWLLIPSAAGAATAAGGAIAMGVFHQRVLDAAADAEGATSWAAWQDAEARYNGGRDQIADARVVGAAGLAVGAAALGLHLATRRVEPTWTAAGPGLMVRFGGDL